MVVWAMCHDPSLVRDKLLGAPASVKRDLHSAQYDNDMIHNMITSKGEPIFTHVNMHDFSWKFMAPSLSRAWNSVMKIAERSSLKILPSPNTNPHHNSSSVEARITKFGPEVQNTLVKIPIVWGLIDVDLDHVDSEFLNPIFLPNLFALFLYYIPWDRPL